MMPILDDCTLDAVTRRVEDALTDLRETYEYVFIQSEWTITAKLMLCLTTQFPTWDVDCEYNKNLGAPKRASVAGHWKSVRPDVIVHRHDSDLNLLAVEVKKFQKQGQDKDRDKLMSYTRPPQAGGLGYKWGVHIVLGKAAADNPSLTWFEAGEVLDGREPTPPMRRRPPSA